MSLCADSRCKPLKNKQIFTKMSYAREYDWIPISNSIQEIHFGKTSSVNMWIEFETSKYEIWRGSFECGENGKRVIIEIGNSEYIIVANGKGYIINSDLKKLNTEIELEEIIDIYKLNANEYLIANYEGISIINTKGELKTITNMLILDEFSVENEDEEYITAKFVSSIYQWKNMYFKFDKNQRTFEIKKRLTKWYKKA